MSRNPSQTVTSSSPKWALAAMFFADGAGFGAWASHLAVIQHNLGLSNGTLTYALLSLIAGAICTMPLVGQLIHRIGSRTPLRVAPFFYFTVLALIGQTHSLRTLLPLAFLFGASKGAYDVSANSHVFTVETYSKRSFQGLFQASWSAGGLIAASVSSILLSAGGSLRTDLGTAASVLGLVALAAMPLLLPDAPHESETKGSTRPDAALLRISSLAFFGLMAEGAIADWASVYLHTEVHVSLAQAAVGYAAFSITMTLSRLASDWMKEHFSAKQILFASGLSIAVGIGIALLFPTWYTTLLGFILTGAGAATIVPVTFDIVGRNSPIGAGPAISTIATVGYFGFLAGPPIIGSIASITGLRIALTVVAVAGLFIALAPNFFHLETKS